MSEELREALRAFDGKAISILSETGLRFRDAPNYLRDLVALAGHDEDHIAAGATWLLKDHLETGGDLAPELVEALLSHLKHAPSWSAALHMLQSVRFLDLARVTDPQIFEAAAQYTGHERPFLRAWAVDALWRLSGPVPALHARADAALADAHADASASVRARARQISKECPR